MRGQRRTVVDRGAPRYILTDAADCGGIYPDCEISEQYLRGLSLERAALATVRAGRLLVPPLPFGSSLAPFQSARRARATVLFNGHAQRTRHAPPFYPGFLLGRRF